MAVIINNVDMPESCADCPICHCKGKDEPWNYCCFVTMDDISIDEWDKERNITCPLKSTDEMIAEIEKLRGCSCYVSDGIIDDVVDIIEEYCKENTDEKETC